MKPKTINILVVDDQKNWRDALFSILTQAGYCVDLAEWFDEAKEKLKRNIYSLVILDVRLVDEDIFNVDGLELLQFVNENFPEMRTVLLTGYPDSVKDKKEVDAFILKVPFGATFDKQKFIHSINNILD